MINASTTIGRFTISVESQNLKSVHAFCDVYGRVPQQCGLCKSQNIHPYTKSPKGNDYVGVRCADCGAELNFHQKKEGGYYLRYDDQWDRYDGGQKTADNSTQQNAEQSANQPGPQDRQDDIPF